jgi:hypothetical protein
MNRVSLQATTYSIKKCYGLCWCTSQFVHYAPLVNSLGLIFCQLCVEKNLWILNKRKVHCCWMLQSNQQPLGVLFQPKVGLTSKLWTQIHIIQNLARYYGLCDINSSCDVFCESQHYGFKITDFWQFYRCLRSTYRINKPNTTSLQKSQRVNEWFVTRKSRWMPRVSYHAPTVFSCLNALPSNFS